jgi:hypothetical protein
VLNFWVVAEIDQQPDAQAHRLKVVVKLGAMLVGQRGQGLDFQNDLVKDKEVRLVDLD